MKMGVMLAERAEMQKWCHTEHLRLIQLFMASKSPSPMPSPCVNTVPGALTHLPESSVQTTYKKLRRQLASAPPGKQKDILYSHLQRAVESLQRPVPPHVLDEIMVLDSAKILALTFLQKSWTAGCINRRSMSFFRNSLKLCPGRGARQKETPSPRSVRC